MLNSVLWQAAVAGGGTVFSPDNISGMVSWWDADSDYITLNGSDVSDWNDRNGSNHLAQATGSKQPAYNSSWRNGRPALTFAGAEILERSTFTGGAEAQPFTIAMVCEWFGSGAEYLISDQGNFNNVQSNGSSSYIYNGTLLNVTSDAPSHGTATVFIWTSDGASTTYEFYPHGDSETSGSGDSGTEGWSGMAVGGRHDENGLVTANIAEIIFYGETVSASDKASLAGHLKAKYAITPS